MEAARPGAVTGAGADPVVDGSRCSGCGRCVAACPLRTLTLETVGYRKTAVLMVPGRCTGCGCCSAACPLGAICS